MQLSESPTNEWDDIVCLPIIDISKKSFDNDNNNNNNDISIITNEREFEFITDQQLIEHIYNIDLGQENFQNQILLEKRSNFLLKLLRYIFFWKSTHLKPNFVAEANRIIRIASHPFDNRNKFHLRCLHTIFSRLTGNAACGFKRFGPHWEEIGFQGSDPSTDFRGVGILGLFQLTFFVVTPRIRALSQEIYELSLDQVQHYPFAITSMNVTQISLQILREGFLNNFINQSDSVLKIFNQLYYGIFLQFHKIWKNDKKTIMDIGYVLKDLKQYCRKNLKKIFVDLTKYQATEDKTTKQENFTNIINININQNDETYPAPIDNPQKSM